MTNITKKTYCRVCNQKKLVKVLDFGPSPLANAFLDKESKDKEEYFYPLEVYFCKNCSFIQLGHVVNPKLLFSNYIYLSSTSPVFVKHFEDFAKKVYKDYSLNKSSLVIDIGSNDGILLKPFKNLGTKTLGIEPAKKIAKLASKDGIKTISEFFNFKLSKLILKKFGKAKIITATNVFAHIDNLDEVLESIEKILEKDGVFIIEAPYIVDFIKNKYFDLIYHEHLSYWSVNTLSKILYRNGFRIIDVEKVSSHGGSIRVYSVKKTSSLIESKHASKFIKKEKKLGIDLLKTYFKFAKSIDENKRELVELLINLKNKGYRIAGYGAPAKAITLLNYFSIGNNTLDFIIDDSKWKQGLYTPGRKILVESADVLEKTKIDYLLILAWNFSDSIIKRNDEFRKKGGRFIIPVPKPNII